jgi:hypothetical protein
LKQLLVAAGVFGSFASIVYLTFPGKPAQPRTYPRDGLLAELGSMKGTAVSTLPAYGFDFRLRQTTVLTLHPYDRLLLKVLSTNKRGMRRRKRRKTEHVFVGIAMR